MKGGITSGVVYPLAICKLAEVYRFRSIGGASAGAIAAAAAAAAEYRRQTSSDKASMDGFASLKELPDKLGETLGSGKTRLSSLFQPTRKTRCAFDVVLAATSKRKLAIASRLVAAQPGPLVLSVLLGFGAGCVGWSSGGGVRAISMLCGALIAVLGLLIGVVCAAWAAAKAIENNNGGLCPGYQPTKEGEDPPLTTWLADMIHAVADVPKDEPLTFGQLSEQNIELVMMTTNLTHGRPHRMPFDREMLFFKKDEMERLFPPAIVNALVTGGNNALKREFKKLNDTPTEAERVAYARDRQRKLKGIHERNPDFLPLPDHDQLPVIFAVRLSLSFPVLLSAVPLYIDDYTRKGGPKLARCWFSDGGICSNLPIHFFDQLLPSRPTFALNLRPPHPDYPVDEKDQTKNIYLAQGNAQGFAERWNNLDNKTLPIPKLLASMIETMQSWNDNMMTRAPGFRDRVVHIHHTSDEGGLNLEMGETTITNMGLRGAAAGDALIKRFHTEDGWDNHVWVRYRSALAMLQGMFQTTHEEFFSNPELRGRLDAFVQCSPEYKELSKTEMATAAAINKAFDTFETHANEELAVNGPRPAIELRPRPRDA